MHPLSIEIFLHTSYWFILGRVSKLRILPTMVLRGSHAWHLGNELYVCRDVHHLVWILLRHAIRVVEILFIFKIKIFINGLTDSTICAITIHISSLLIITPYFLNTYLGLRRLHA
jgi:hypothetical protein